MLPHSTSIRLVTQLDALDLVLAGATDAALTRRPAPDEWSAHENLAHLARHHEVMLDRIRRIRAEDRPRFARYRAEEDPEWAKWPGLPPGEVLGRLRTLRRHLIELVESLPPAELERVGLHPVFGAMTVPAWLEFFLLHEAHHLYVVLNRVHAA